LTPARNPLTASQHTFRLPPDKGQGHLMQMLEILARIEGVEEPQFLGAVRQETVHLAWGTTVVIITSRESQELLETLLMLRQSGFQLSVMMVQPPAYDQPPIRQLQQLAIPTFRITRERDLEVCSPVL
jgi:uncharacterized protein (DUF58 family)